MKLIFQILARMIFWPIILAGMLFTVLNIAAKLMIDEITLRSIVAYTLSETLQGQAELTWARLSPSGEILIRGLRLRNPDNLEENLLSAENVILRFSPISLLYGKPKISELTLIAPRLELVKDKDGEWNLHRYIAGRKGGNEIRRYDVMVHETYIRDAEIRITDKKENTVDIFQNLNASLRDFTPDNDTPFDISSSFDTQGLRKPAEGRIFARGRINFESFDFSKTSIRNLSGKFVINGYELPFSGNVYSFTQPIIRMSVSTPEFSHKSLDFLCESPLEFTAPAQDWNISLSLKDRRIELQAETDPLDINVLGHIYLSTSPASYDFRISAPPLALEDIKKHLDVIVQNPRGKVKPMITVESDKDGSPKITELTGDFTNSNFKYRNFTAMGLDMLVKLPENLENSNITVYDGRLQLKNQRLNTLVLKGSISKKEMDMSFSGRLNSDPTRGKFSIMNPFSKVKSVFYTGYSEDLYYQTAKSLVFDLVDFFAEDTKKRTRKFSQLDWVNQLRNSIPSGYSLFTIAYKAGMFRHEYIQAKDFYVTLTMNSLSGRIENFKGSLSVKTGAGILFNVEENSKKDHIHYLASMPLRFIDELNKKKAFKFNKLQNVSFKSMGGDIKASKGIATIENFYMEGDEFSACLTGQVDFINETVDLKIYTIMDKYSRGVLPAGLTDASGKSAMAFSLKGKMDSPTLNMLSPKDSSKRIAEAALREPAINFGKIRRLLGGK